MVDLLEYIIEELVKVFRHKRLRKKILSYKKKDGEREEYSSQNTENKTLTDEQD